MKLEQMAKAAQQVAQQQAGYEEAIAVDRGAQAELLRLVVEAAMPALPACSSRILSSSAQVGKGTPDQTYFQHHQGKLVNGFPVSDNGGFKKLDAGKIGGQALYLLGDGTFAVTSYHGSHSPTESYWNASMRELSPAEVVAERWDVGAILEYVGDAITQQLDGKKVVSTVRIEREAERINALALLFKGIS